MTTKKEIEDAIERGTHEPGCVGVVTRIPRMQAWRIQGVFLRDIPSICEELAKVKIERCRTPVGFYVTKPIAKGARS